MTTVAPNYFGQFILARSSPAAPGGWPRRQHAGWHLATHPSLPVVDVKGVDDASIGWLIGHAIGGSGQQPYVVRELSTSPDIFEQALYPFGGRYVAVMLTPHASRLYLDPGGTLAAVYAPDRATVASTSSLIRFADAETYAARKLAEPPLAANEFFPAGLTPDPEIRRLLPSHFLDLDTWQVARHWPTGPIKPVSADGVNVSIAKTVDRMRATLRAATASQPAYMGLTAGRDSRMVLAAAKDVKDRITWVTFDYPDADKHADLHIARKLARRFGLRHEIVPLTKPTLADKQRYLFNIGFAGNDGKARDFDGACATYLKRDHAWLTGYGGEVGRAFYWRWEDKPGMELATDELLARMKMSHRPDFRSSLDAWRIGTGVADDPYTLLDLMYVEQRLGCWASVHGYGTAPFAMQLTPFNHRDVFDAMLRLPVDFRIHQRLADEVIRQAWPELLELPYQKLTGARMFADRVKKKIGRVAKRLKLRK